MKRIFLSFLPLVLISGVSAPAQAQNLLGIVGGSGEEALITIGSGDASNTGLVNIGLGGENQLVDAQVGGSSNLASATVGSGGGSLLDANVGLLNGAVGVDATVGGGSLANIGVNIGGGGGTPGNGGNPGNGGGNGGGVGNGGGLPGSSASNTVGVPACAGSTSPREVQRLIQGTQIGGSWQRASNVQIRRVDMCPDMQTWLASALTSSGLGNSLRSAINSDSLISASISRSSYNSNRVFAVKQSGNQLTVFVY
jgi:hypothetical protein